MKKKFLRLTAVVNVQYISIMYTTFKMEKSLIDVTEKELRG